MLMFKQHCLCLNNTYKEKDVYRNVDKTYPDSKQAQQHIAIISYLPVQQQEGELAICRAPLCVF